MAFKDEKHRQAVDSKQTAEILKESVRIVDALAKIDYDFYQDGEEVEKLIEKAQKLTKHRLWKLK